MDLSAVYKLLIDGINYQFARRIAYVASTAIHLDSFSSQAARGSSRQKTASSRSSVDRTALFLLAAANPNRPWQKQARAHGRKRPLASATHHPQTASETARLHENRSSTPRPDGQVGSYLAADPCDRSTRHPAQVASRALSLRLEAQIKDSCSQAQGSPRNHRLEKTRWRMTIGFGVLSAFVGNC
jgi:hypothetical protein